MTDIAQWLLKRLTKREREAGHVHQNNCSALPIWIPEKRREENLQREAEVREAYSVWGRVYRRHIRRQDKNRSERTIYREGGPVLPPREIFLQKEEGIVRDR